MAFTKSLTMQISEGTETKWLGGDNEQTFKGKTEVLAHMGDLSWGS